MNFDREQTLKQWDYWRKYIAEGWQADGPRVWLETLLDQFDEQEKTMTKRELKNVEELVKLLRYQNELPAKIRQVEFTLVDIKQALANAADTIDMLLTERKALLETIDEWRESKGIPRKSA